MNYRPNRIDETGKRFGRLFVLGFHGNRDNGTAFWECLCDCGNKTISRGRELRVGRTKSCGCWKVDIHRTHGMEGTRVYEVWSSMKARCQNPKHQAWDNYGGRGISVCDRWHKFENFYYDMGEPALGRVLDRIDNNKGYSPSNCRWGTWSESNKNQRRYMKEKNHGS